jgi:hypothetical protein
MADIKFSQFTNLASPSGASQVVGLSSGNNVRMSLSSIDLGTLGGNINLTSQVTGTLRIADGGTGSSTAGVSTVGALLDEGSQVIGDVLTIQDDGAGNSVLATGSAVNISPPSLQLKISGTSGLANTNNTTDFKVPYNTVIVNDDATIYNPTISGGLGVQGDVQVLQAGRYYIQARYSTFDLVQPSLPTVDGTKFLRITATVNGVKTCVFHNLLIATSGNGEAVATGSGIMDLAVNDVFSLTGFHTGATGGSGTQGFPVSNNSLFNEPMLWMVKIG